MVARHFIIDVKVGRGIKLQARNYVAVAGMFQQFQTTAQTTVFS